MSLELDDGPCPERLQRRRGALLVLMISIGSGVLTLFTTHDAQLSVEMATFILAAAESLYRE